MKAATLFNRLDTKALISEPDIAKARYHMDNLSIDSKIKLVLSVWESTRYSSSYSLRILFWNGIHDVLQYIRTYSNDILSQEVTNMDHESNPGVIQILSNSTRLLRNLLIAHFNYELGSNPALNIRLQFSSNTGNAFVLFDVYDDRGMDVYFNYWHHTDANALE